MGRKRDEGEQPAETSVWKKEIRVSGLFRRDRKKASGQPPLAAAGPDPEEWAFGPAAADVPEEEPAEPPTSQPADAWWEIPAEPEPAPTADESAAPYGWDEPAPTAEADVVAGPVPPEPAAAADPVSQAASVWWQDAESEPPVPSWGPEGVGAGPAPPEAVVPDPPAEGPADLAPQAASVWWQEPAPVWDPAWVGEASLASTARPDEAEPPIPVWDPASDAVESPAPAWDPAGSGAKPAPPDVPEPPAEGPAEPAPQAASAGPDVPAEPEPAVEPPLAQPAETSVWKKEIRVSGLFRRDKRKASGQPPLDVAGPDSEGWALEPAAADVPEEKPAEPQAADAWWNVPAEPEPGATADESAAPYGWDEPAPTAEADAVAGPVPPEPTAAADPASQAASVWWQDAEPEPPVPSWGPEGVGAGPAPPEAAASDPPAEDPADLAPQAASPWQDAEPEPPVPSRGPEGVGAGPAPPEAVVPDPPAEDSADPAPQAASPWQDAEPEPPVPSWGPEGVGAGPAPPEAAASDPPAEDPADPAPQAASPWQDAEPEPPVPSWGPEGVGAGPAPPEAAVPDPPAEDPADPAPQAASAWREDAEPVAPAASPEPEPLAGAAEPVAERTSVWKKEIRLGPRRGPKVPNQPKPARGKPERREAPAASKEHRARRGDARRPRGASQLPDVPLVRSLNLLPRDEPKANRRRPKLAQAGVALITVLLLGGGAFLFVLERQRVDGKKQVVAELEARVSALETPSGAAPSQGNDLAGELVGRASALSSALDGRFVWDRLLRELSLVLPADVWFDSIVSSAPVEAALATDTTQTATTPLPTVPTAAIVTISGYAKTQNGVAQLLARLVTLRELVSVRLVSATLTDLGDEKVVQFSVTAQLAPAGTRAAS